MIVFLMGCCTHRNNRRDAYDDINDTDQSRNASFQSFTEALQFLLTKGGNAFAAKEQEILDNRAFLDGFEQLDIDGEARAPPSSQP